MMRVKYVLAILTSLLPATHTFTLSNNPRHITITALTRSPPYIQLMTAADDTQENILPDDGGGKGDNINVDLTDRFKYKVNALMGQYDPVQSDNDTENNDGNILAALLQFPTTYSFTIVGRTDGDPNVQNSYIEDAKKILVDNCSPQSISDGDGNAGDGAEESAEIVCVVKPRGEKFVKITMEVMVESAAQIQLVFEELGALECTVMTF